MRIVTKTAAILCIVGAAVFVCIFAWYFSMKSSVVDVPVTNSSQVLPQAYSTQPIYTSTSLENQPSLSSYASTTITMGGEEFIGAIANTAPLRELGLSGQQDLADKQVMVFVFPTPNTYAFWMKDMKFALDMIWVNASGKIVYIKKNALPESYPMAFTPPESVNIVIETKTGLSDMLGIKVGDSISFDKKLIEKSSK